MSKTLPVVSTRDVLRALAKVGFREIPRRGKGSHRVAVRESPRRMIIVPERREVPTGTMRAIIREAGLTVDEFRALL